MLIASLGAEPLAYGDTLVGAVRKLVPDGVDAVADFHGDNLEATLAVLKGLGRHASIADESVTQHGGRYIWVRPDGRELEYLDALVDDGKLTVNVVAVRPMQDAAAALAQSMDGHTAGRIALTEFTG